MGKRPKQKRVLFLVEGTSDKKALNASMLNLYEALDPEYIVDFIIKKENEKLGGDITSTVGVHPGNIEKMVLKFFIDDYIESKHIYPKDITEIIQIIDTDGAFIDDKHIVESKSGSLDGATFYFDDRIETASVSRIIERNDLKRQNIKKLLSLTTIKVGSKSIPYSAYYFSSNLDHFLHGDANLTSRDKINFAEAFADECDDKENFFEYFFLNDNDSSQQETLKESWDYIMKGENSLQRHTNINLLIERLLREADSH